MNFTVSLFPDVKATRLTARTFTADELAERLRTTKVYPEKSACPLIKLAVFGEDKTENGSLRHDANVVEVHGIEGDYDGELISFGEAQQLLHNHDLTGILYTSARHTPQTPRWRVLCPLSAPCGPKQREALVARLNGALGGILAPESFTLSQSYYIGRVAGAPYESAQVRGRCIDEAVELDAIAIRPPVNGVPRVERLKEIRSSDPVIARLAALDYILRKRHDGGVDIVCPFEAEHTTPRAPGDCTYWPAHTGGFEAAHFHCLHSHCKQRPDEDFRRALGMEDPAPGMRQADTADEVTPDGVTLDDFHAYMPMHQYLFAPSRDLWPASSVNARIDPVATGRKDKAGTEIYQAAAAWLDQNRAVEQMTWAPGEPMLIANRLVSGGGWIARPGCTCLNLYRPPTSAPGDVEQALRWVDHVHRLYPEEADHIIRWLAHRVQSPGEKINHAIVLGGAQGIGKDTLLVPVAHAVGPWNFTEVSPAQLLGRFNGFIKSVILRVSEARDLGDVDRYGFYEHLKAYTAAPPDVLRVDEKNLREYAVLNCCGVVITTNHLADGIYLPADDRRHFVAWSGLTREDFAPGYWISMYAWLEHGGSGHVCAYLRELDLTGFDPKAPPPKTAAFWEVVDANRAPEDAELADVLDDLGNPDAVTLLRLVGKAGLAFGEWLQDRKNRRQIPHRMEAAGYVPVRNDAAKSGLFVVAGKRQVVYAKRTLTLRDRIAAATALAG